MKLSTLMIQLAISYSVTETVNGFAPATLGLPSIQQQILSDDITAAFAATSLQMASTLQTEPPKEEEKTQEELADAAAKQAYDKEEDNDADSDKRKEEVFAELGIAEDELALGIDPDELVKYAKS